MTQTHDGYWRDPAPWPEIWRAIGSRNAGLDWSHGRMREFDIMTADKLLTRQQEEHIKILCRLIGIALDGKAMAEMQRVVGISGEKLSWRMATRRQADRMIGMMINYVKERGGVREISA